MNDQRTMPLPDATRYLTHEVRYKFLKLLETKPLLSQRELADELGISLGKVNYCLRALVRQGWIKAANFRNSRNKAAYMYLLTPRGMEEKVRVTAQFLQVKVREYETLKREIRQMRHDVQRQGRSQDGRREDTAPLDSAKRSG